MYNSCFPCKETRCITKLSASSVVILGQHRIGPLCLKQSDNWTTHTYRLQTFKKKSEDIFIFFPPTKVYRVLLWIRYAPFLKWNVTKNYVSYTLLKSPNKEEKPNIKFHLLTRKMFIVMLYIILLLHKVQNVHNITCLGKQMNLYI